MESKILKFHILESYLFFLDILCVSEPAITRESDFVYKNERLNRLILDKNEFGQSTADSDLLQIISWKISRLFARSYLD